MILTFEHHFFRMYLYIFQFSRIVLRREDGEQHISFGLFRFGSNIELNEHFKNLKTFIK